ncbi:MAG: hypothetical protein ABF289_03350, partial [Clostridiales bacterium]
MEKYKNIPIKPKFKDHFNWVPMSEDVVQARSLENIFTIKGKSVIDLMPKLIPLLDGSNTISDIVCKLDNVEEDVIKQAIVKLTQYYMIEDAEKKNNCSLTKDELKNAKNQIEFFSRFADRQSPSGDIVDKYQIFESIKDSKCLLVGLGNLGVSVL